MRNASSENDVFGKNQFNLAKGLKAAQVHTSDTPSRILLHKEKHVDIVDRSDARPRGLWVFGEADIE